MAGLDEELFRSLNQAGSSVALDVLMVALTVLGFTYILVLSAVPLWITKHKTLAYDLVITVIVTSVLVEVLKIVFDRPRPLDSIEDVKTSTIQWFTTASGLSFPSGHAARAFAVATLILLRSWNGYSAFALALAASIAMSRVYLGLHWPSDILAGALLGIALGAAIHQVQSGDNWYVAARTKLVGALEKLR